MEGRMMKDASYRFGFNGKEKDGEGEWGNSAHYDYGFRIYDPSIARFLSVDPLTDSYPFYTPYQFAGNKPIWKIDLDGLEPTDPPYLWDPSWTRRYGHGSMLKVDGWYVWETSNSTGPEIHRQYYDPADELEPWKDFEATKPEPIYNEVRDFAVTSVGLTLTTVMGSVLAGGKGIDLLTSTAFEFGAAALVGDLGEFDFIDAAAGGLVGFYPSLAIGSLADYTPNKGLSTYGGVIGEEKDITSVAVDATIGLVFKGLEIKANDYASKSFKKGFGMTFYGEEFGKQGLNLLRKGGAVNTLNGNRALEVSGELWAKGNNLMSRSRFVIDTSDSFSDVLTRYTQKYFSQQLSKSNGTK